MDFLFRFQNKAKFTAWSKEAMKIGLCSIPPAGHPASLLCMINSTAMSSLFKDVIHQFDRLYNKKVKEIHIAKLYFKCGIHFLKINTNYRLTFITICK